MLRYRTWRRRGGQWAGMGIVRSPGSANNTRTYFLLSRTFDSFSTVWSVRITGLIEIYTRFSFEGENFVLDQQVVRAALKAFTTLMNCAQTQGRHKVIELARSLPPSSAYLKRLLPGSDKRPSEPPVLSDASWVDHGVLIDLIEWRASLLVHELAQTTDLPDATIYQRVSKAATEAFVAGRVGEMISRLDESGMKPRDKEVLKKVYVLVSRFLRPSYVCPMYSISTI